MINFYPKVDQGKSNRGFSWLEQMLRAVLIRDGFIQGILPFCLLCS